MATTLYIRSSGSDSNSGTSGSPLRTAQKAFNLAYAGTGSYILNFGSSTFAGINLRNVPGGASSWPSRITIVGAGSTSSFLGGIDAKGYNSSGSGGGEYDYVAPTNGLNLYITSDQTINLGNINCDGGDDVIDNFQSPSAGFGGYISLNSCIFQNASSSGGSNIYYNGYDSSHSASGGNINITNSTGVDVFADGNIGCGAGGSITVTNSQLRNLSASSSTAGSDCDTGANGGTVYLTNSSVHNITVNGGSTITSGSCGGNAGTVSNSGSTVTGTITSYNGSPGQDILGYCGGCAVIISGGIGYCDSCNETGDASKQCELDLLGILCAHSDIDGLGYCFGHCSDHSSCGEDSSGNCLHYNVATGTCSGNWQDANGYYCQNTSSQKDCCGLCKYIHGGLVNCFTDCNGTCTDPAFAHTDPNNLKCSTINLVHGYCCGIGIHDDCGVPNGTCFSGCDSCGNCGYSGLDECGVTNGCCHTNCDLCNNCGSYHGGCTNNSACNYDACANYDDGSCQYNDACGVCDGTCHTNCDLCGNCGNYHGGCTDAGSCNGADNCANYDDGSCQYNDACGNCGGTCHTNCDTCGNCGNYHGGCLDDTAYNFDTCANYDDGSCQYPDNCGRCCAYGGCKDSNACNYDECANYDDGSCSYGTGDSTCGCNNPADACGVCGNYHGGCTTDSRACNYDSCANYEDSSCSYGTGNPDCGCDISYDNCGRCGAYDACKDSNACNYDSCANFDNGSCTYGTGSVHCGCDNGIDLGCGCRNGWNGSLPQQNQVLFGITYGGPDNQYTGTLNRGTSKSKVILSATLGVPIF